MTLKEAFLVLIKGAMLGIGNVIPGVSGGALAISLGLYETIVNSLGNFFKDIRKNFKLLLPIILGTIIGILSAGQLITFLLGQYKTQTILFFVGVIFGGVSIIMRKSRKEVTKSNLLLCLLIFVAVTLFNFLDFNAVSVSLDNLGYFDYIKIFFLGLLASTSMLIPGISSSIILMLAGFYRPIIEALKLLFTKEAFLNSFIILAIFAIGVLLGLFLIAKVVSLLLKKYEFKAYWGILGFVLASIVLLFLQIDTFTVNFTNIFTCILTFLWGYVLARCLEREKYFY